MSAFAIAKCHSSGCFCKYTSIHEARIFEPDKIVIGIINGMVFATIPFCHQIQCSYWQYPDVAGRESNQNLTQVEKFARSALVSASIFASGEPFTFCIDLLRSADGDVFLWINNRQCYLIYIFFQCMRTTSSKKSSTAAICIYIHNHFSLISSA